MDDSLYTIEELLELCLIRLQAGETAEEILRDYPAYADELEPLLAARQALASWQAPALSARARAAARTRARVELRRIYYRQQGGWGWGGLVLRLAVALTLAFTLLGGGVALAERSLPGDALYGLKRASESARLGLATNPASRAELSLALADRRADEIASLGRSGRDVDPNLLADLEAAYDRAVGAITTAPGDRRDALALRFREDLAGHQAAFGEAIGGARTDEVRAALGAARDLSRVAAGRIGDDDDEQPAPPTATATPSPTREPTETREPTATARPTRTATPEPSVTPSPAPSATATPRPRPRPTQTATPVPPPPTQAPAPSETRETETPEADDTPETETPEADDTPETETPETETPEPEPTDDSNDDNGGGGGDDNGGGGGGGDDDNGGGGGGDDNRGGGDDDNGGGGGGDDNGGDDD